MNETFRRIVLKSRPDGLPMEENFELETVAVPELAEGQFLVRNEYLGLAPASRIRMSETPATAGYSPATPLGEVIYSQSLGRVVESRHPEYEVGAMVTLTGGGWQEISLSDGALTQRIDEALSAPTHWLGALGVSGHTAYAGILTVGELKPSEVVVVSAASGAVGAIAAQIAKVKGCRVIGIAGGADKCRFLRDELRLDAAIDHRSEHFDSELREATEGGVDLYFDNVGGKIRDEMLGLMADFGRMVVCGMIAEYNHPATSSGPSWLPILTKRLTVRGFLLRDHLQQRDEFVRVMSSWIHDGSIKIREDITVGLENTPDAFIRMLSGKTFGKTIVEL